MEERDKPKVNPYTSYIYSFPHKRAYRDFEKPENLRELWGKNTDKDISLYIHIPFCTNKCGYCNLMSTTCFTEKRLEEYVNKLTEEMKAYGKILKTEENPDMFTSVILGGGTPTILSTGLMEKLLKMLEKYMNIDFEKIFFSVETSPKTLTPEYLLLLEKYHLNRLSIGVQSFYNNELTGIFRYELEQDIEKALKAVFSEINRIEIRNLDLIYGLPEQTEKTWENSLQRVIQYKPEEIFIYPLYIREKTKLYYNYKADRDLMIKMYENAADILKKNGYIQTSMRNFILSDMKEKLYPEYSCQENKMLGLGCGARSYIENIHYSGKYAVEDKNINNIIDNYLKKENSGIAKYGYKLSPEEQKIKYILKSILKITGFKIEEYREKYIKDPLEDFPELDRLINEGYLINENGRIFPAEKGLMYSDYIGTLFITDSIKRKTEEFTE
jgi:oxygen-independent coproporphyrinogen-3 oxidase